MPAPKNPNTSKATETNKRRGDESAARRLRERGWTVIAPTTHKEPPMTTEPDDTNERPLPEAIYASKIPGRTGRLYEFDVDDTPGAVKDALAAAGIANVYIVDGHNAGLQSWDRDVILRYYDALKQAGCRIVREG